MNMKRVAFDIGNVLFRVDLNTFVADTVKYGLYPDLEKAQAFMDGIQAAQDLGLYTLRQAIDRFHPNTSPFIVSRLESSWISTVKPCIPMFKLINELLDDGWQVALLSNIGYDHRDDVKLRIGRRIWNDCIHHFSCEVGARKPAKLFFQSFFIERGWKDTQKICFFDDRPENVLACKDYLRGVQFNLEDFEDGEDAARELKTFLLKTQV
jgi:FMN phosphatase YigB (HAD superfamily)